MKYSMGPWEILKIPDRDYISGEIYQILDANGAAIATMNISETFLAQAGSRDVMVANATLISTAPELYEALKVAQIQLLGDGGNAASQPVLDVINKALKKAVGR